MARPRKQAVISTETTPSPTPKVTPVVEKKPVKVKAELDRNMMVPVANFTNGTLVYVSTKTNAMYQFEGFGTVDDIELFELVTMRSSQPTFLNFPWLLVLDEDVVDYLGLNNMYKNIIKPEDLNKFFEMTVPKMRDFLNKAPKGMKELIVSKAQEMIRNEEFDSVSKIKLIEEVTGYKFEKSE